MILVRHKMSKVPRRSGRERARGRRASKPDEKHMLASNRTAPGAIGRGVGAGSTDQECNCTRVCQCHQPNHQSAPEDVAARGPCPHVRAVRGRGLMPCVSAPACSSSMKPPQTGFTLLHGLGQRLLSAGMTPQAGCRANELESGCL